ncbi:chloride channel protein [Acutalibacter intestini]|uniref:chloride channel protein n=1 Tax=Acutalibacter intestini TaxID=3093659 RepID=UPI002AC9C5F7|nr:chloride channel protein [Acutalibacter sp. M00204]
MQRNEDRMLMASKDVGQYLLAFLRWVIAALAIGAVCGFLGSCFHILIDRATETRQTYPLIVWLLPCAGLITLLLYRLCKVSFGTGTNLIIQSVTTNEHIPVLLAPLIVAGTLLSHLFGASVGREGAALQLGGSLGHNFGELLRFDEDDVRVLSMCGMAACFSAMFGTPLAAAVFVLEVIVVGSISYNAFLPCVAASYTAFFISGLLGVPPMRFELSGSIPGLTPATAGQTALLAALCGGVGILLCVALHQAAHWAEKLIKNSYLRIVLGGVLMTLLVVLFGLYDYTGAGAHIIEKAVGGQTVPWAFLLKIILTALCVVAGFRGGEIVPTLFVGATFGCAVGPLLGLDPSFAAAVGMCALFCSVVNCPIATLFLAAELFSTGELGLFALAIAVSFVLSGYFGLYSSQVIRFSKVKHRTLDTNTH